MNQEDLNAIYKLKEHPNSICISPTRLNPQLVARVLQECSNSEYWHKFMIKNVDLPREVLLKTIVDFVHPSDLFPVCYCKKARTYFLARNCLEAILKFISNQLVIPNPVNPFNPLNIIIIANQVPTSLLSADFLQPADLANILKKRFTPKTNSLDLSNFHSDPDLKEFCMLSQVKLMSYVLQYVSELKRPPSKILLCDNFIRILDPLYLIADLNVHAIDLRNNELATMEALNPLRNLKELTNVRLDGNPLCELYSSTEYVSRLKQICPKLQTIDTQVIFDANGFFMPQKNFLSHPTGGDLVNQFVEYFFTVYDGEDRSKIMDLYHKDAMFSVTSSIILNQKTTSTARLTHYVTINRNLRAPTRCFGNKDNGKHLYQGSANIMKIFKFLPRTIHDPLHFQCDLVYYRMKQAILVVHGVFQEGSEKLGFTRSFVLQRGNDNSCCIINDQLHVYNALNCQLRVAHGYPQNVEHTRNPLPYYNRQFWELREAVRTITNLNYDYSQRFLETFNYDLKSVLSNFVKLHVINEIPPEAFVEHRTEPMLNSGSKSNRAKKKMPLPDDIVNKTSAKYGFVTLNTTWNAVHEERLLADLNVTDPSSKIYEVLHCSNAEQPQNEQNRDLAEYVETPSTVYVIDDEESGTSQDNTETGGIATSPGKSQDNTEKGKIGTSGMSQDNTEKGRIATSVIKKQRTKALNIIRKALLQDPAELGEGANRVVAEVVVKTLGKKIRGRARKKTVKTDPVNINIIKQQYYFPK